MIPESDLKSWTRQAAEVTYICTTDPKCIQLDALNAALDSDMMWWAKAFTEEQLQKTVDNSLCLSLYLQDQTVSNEPRVGKMVGFARIITDFVTFGYLTDVYVLEEHQRKGLGRWMMDCLNEVISAWPDMRRFMILTGDLHAAKMYQETLGTQDIRETTLKKITILERIGPAVKHRAE